MDKVILWNNGIVMVFNRSGLQMPRFQGSLNRVHRQIMANSKPYTEFIGKWPTMLPYDWEQYCILYGLEWSNK